MKIIMEAKKISELLESVRLRGRYFDGVESKISELSPYAYMSLNGQILEVWNADNTTVCGIRETIEGDELENGIAVLDIKKTVNYLKGFNDEVTFEANDFLYISDDSSNATLPLIIEHSHQPMINMLIGFNETVRDVNVTFPTFRKTTFETKLHVYASDLSKATNGCDVINTARYKFDYNETFKMSTIRNDLDKYETEITLITSDGEPSTVEFTGFFHGFFNTVLNIYLKDEAPVLFVSPNRILLKAPYLDRG